MIINLSICTLQETNTLTMDNINKCKNSVNSFWCKTFKTFKIVNDNFLAENPDHRLLQLINGNSEITLDGRSKYWKSLENKTMAYTVTPDYSLASITQYMLAYSEQMWIKQRKIRIEFKDYKKCFSKYVERSAIFNPITEKTLNQVILNKVKEGCSFFYKCLTYHKRMSFNWNKQKEYWENILGKSYEDAEWSKIIDSMRDIKNNNYHKEHQLRIIRNNIFTNKRLTYHVPGITKYCDYCTEKI